MSLGSLLLCERILIPLYFGSARQLYTPFLSCMFNLPFFSTRLGQIARYKYSVYYVYVKKFLKKTC